MSGRKAKLARSFLRQVKLPIQNERIGFGSKAYEYQANHERRIKTLAKSEGVGLKTAVDRYTKKVGMIKKSEAEKYEKPTKANS